MAVAHPLTMSLIEQGVKAAEFRYKIDQDGDLHIGVSRKKGKDLDFYVWQSPIEREIVALACFVTRWFKESELARAMQFCNDWNRKTRVPKAYVTEPDEDGDYRVRLEHTILCDGGVTVEQLEHAIGFFVWSSMQFWDQLDEAI
jgi:hypothetical protein